MATVVMVFVFLSALTALQHGFEALDTARNTTLAGQIIQSEIEDIRLKSWSTLPSSGTIDLSTSVASSLSASEIQKLQQRFTATRSITPVSGRESDFRHISIAVDWQDFTGRAHRRAYETYLGRNGLSDYFVTTHSNTSTP